MSASPREIEGARAIEWQWSGYKPFGVVCFQGGKVAAEIFSLAIYKYPNNEIIYRFVVTLICDTEQDYEYVSIQEAKAYLPYQYNNVVANW